MVHIFTKYNSLEPFQSVKLFHLVIWQFLVEIGFVGFCGMLSHGEKSIVNIFYSFVDSAPTRQCEKTMSSAGISLFLTLNLSQTHNPLGHFSKKAWNVAKYFSHLCCSARDSGLTKFWLSETRLQRDLPVFTHLHCQIKYFAQKYFFLPSCHRI